MSIADRTESRMERSEARQSRLIPATWMMALNGSRPAEVIRACPTGNGPVRPISMKGWRPPRRLIAPDTPCGSNSHHGITFRFQALTMTSTG